MNKLFVLCAAACFASSAIAAEPAAAPKTAQQNKMTTCNADAAGKKGDERKAFMKNCLSAKPAEAAAPATQQTKMKTCNADAAGKKGDERKAFMKACLSAPKS
ncbi:MAG: phosphate starvation-inducible protein PsiF [Burkholderiaceae bacterium]|nr:phosphate starvation-inducible protein PsiF [Burkholderiaceae bacterium]